MATSPLLALSGLLETALYVKDVPVTVDFYTHVLDLKVLQGPDQQATFAALLVPGGAILLIFRIGANQKPIELSGGTIPPHDGRGMLHLAFAIPTGEMDRWRTRLTESDIKIESEMHWPNGCRSIYFRDPDQHLVELASSDLWTAARSASAIANRR
jgi:catechol 2,3-dioxygenase-like lactoylglutathione lyase family enzyme